MSHVFPQGYVGRPGSAECAAYSGRYDWCRDRYARRVSTPGAERGVRLGLPASGAGSLAGTGARIGAFVLDALLSTLVAGLFTQPSLPRLWSLLALALEYTFFGSTFGQTPGMAAFKVALVRVEATAGSGEPSRASVARVALRTLLLLPLVPAVIVDADGRGLHDRATGTAVIRLR
jgi:uncharacterized RDD family membrane protein YckC